jgi:peptidoglycan/xylan/chitin deacetylase (PgdA/CDA1 family)
VIPAGRNLPDRALVVTIDTEEEGRWTSSYPPTGNTCRNIARLPRIHGIFRELGVVPTYLVDYPVATDREACDVLCGFVAEDRVEIGAHVHPWCNPPFDGGAAAQENAPAATYIHTLPPAMQKAKLERLCDAIERAFGTRPSSYRAGRWGFDRTSVPVLEELGIRVDTSINPLWWDPAQSALGFVRAPLGPYRIDRDDVCRPGDSRLVEAPATGLVVGPHGPALEKMIRAIGPLRGLRRVWRKAGLRFLKPEDFSFEEMRGAVDAMAARGLRFFNVTFHSSVALPGATPYVADEAELDRFCDRLERILEHIVVGHRVTPLALSDIPAFLDRRDAALVGQPRSAE